MIKAVMTMKDGSPGLVLGLTKENVAKLRAGQPIHIEGKPLGLGIQIIVMYGDTPQQIVDQLREGGLEVPDLPAEKPTPGHDIVVTATKKH